jgi:hypothetical protein
MGRPETIEETGDLIAAVGGAGSALLVDHENPASVVEFVSMIDGDRGGCSRRRDSRLAALGEDAGQPRRYRGELARRVPGASGLRNLRVADLCGERRCSTCRGRRRQAWAPRSPALATSPALRVYGRRRKLAGLLGYHAAYIGEQEDGRGIDEFR